MNKVRGFEVVTKYANENIRLPKRATEFSAGYDIEAADDIVIPSIWRLMKENKDAKNNEIGTAVLVPTGIKAYMPENEYLMLVNRSSNPLKHNLALPNGIGIIDADYYNNRNNEGEIYVQLINYGVDDYQIKKGDRIAQGIFNRYHTIDDEGNHFNERLGGFGSTGKNKI